MTPEEKALVIAARIADGSAIDWPAAESSVSADADGSVLDELKAIAALAALHRAPAPLEEEAAGSKWGPLTRIARIGEGRFGAVFLAWDARLHRRVALKLLHLPSRAPADSSSQAIEEARLLARVRHPNVLMVYGAENIDGEIGIWTEFIEGRTLEAMLAETGPLSSSDVIAIGLDLCDALSAVHAAGLLHRDVKAQNVMRETGGRIVLMDFGTSHDLEAMPARPSDLSGTPLYLAPELFGGEQPSVASDVYALAVLLFYLLTRRYPVPGRTLEEVRIAHDEHRRVALDDLRGDLPAPVRRAIEGGLAVARSDRYADTAGFKSALIAATDPASSVRTRPRASRLWLTAAAAALVTIAGVMALDAGGLRTRLTARPQPPGGGPDKAFAAAGPSAMTAATVPVPPSPAPSATPPATHLPASSPPAPIAAPVPDRVEPAMRRIRLPTRQMGLPSSDGRYMPYVDDGGNLQVWEVATNRSRLLTDAKAPEAARFSVMAPAGDRVVYGWSLTDGAFELRLVNADGTWPRALIGRQTVFQPIPVDWSRDGTAVLCWLRQKDGSVDLALVPVDGGQPKIIETLPGQPATSSIQPAGAASLSPDGRFVTYARRMPPPAQGRSLFIVGTDGSPARMLLPTVADDALPRWTPDGAHVVFLRLSPGLTVSTQAMKLRVVDGAAAGEPLPFATGIGAAVSLFVTDAGAMYTQLFFSGSEINVLPFDPTGAAAPGPPTRISVTTVGNHAGPAWSPDGRAVAYFATQAAEPGTVPRRTLTIQDLATRKEQSLQPALSFLGGYTPAWMADSQSVVVWGKDRDVDGRFGYYRVDIQTSETRAVVLGEYAPARAWCSPDGRSFIYIDPARGIVSHRLADATETVLVPKGNRSSIETFAISPDGQSIAFGSVRSVNGQRRYSLEMRTVDGASRELTSAIGERLVVHAWTPDGHSLVLTRSREAATTHALWLFDLAAGEARDLQASMFMDLVTQIRLSPDGRKLAYTERDDAWELWIRPGMVAK